MINTFILHKIKLEKIEGLDENFRLKHLYLFNNRLKTLEGSIRVMRHLETLIAYNNELRDLQKQIDFLKPYTHLQTVDFFKNPLAEEPNYRLRVIHALPSLKLLDRHGKRGFFLI